MAATAGSSRFTDLKVQLSVTEYAQVPAKSAMYISPSHILVNVSHFAQCYEPQDHDDSIDLFKPCTNEQHENCYSGF